MIIILILLLYSSIYVFFRLKKVIEGQGQIFRRGHVVHLYAVDRCVVLIILVPTTYHLCL